MHFIIFKNILLMWGYWAWARLEKSPSVRPVIFRLNFFNFWVGPIGLTFRLITKSTATKSKSGLMLDKAYVSKQVSNNVGSNDKPNQIYIAQFISLSFVPKKKNHMSFHVDNLPKPNNNNNNSCCKKTSSQCQQNMRWLQLKKKVKIQWIPLI